MSLSALSSRAIIVDPQRDNVALAVAEIAAGRYEVRLKPDTTGDAVRLKPDTTYEAYIDVAEPVAPGQRIALRDIPAGAFLIQYGCPFAISRGIRRGQRADPDRIEPAIPKIDPASIDLADDPPAPPLPGDETLPATFAGYRRSNGLVGTRNYVLIIPTSMCASHESKLIADDAERRFWSHQKFPNVDGVRAIPHDKGCGCPDGSAVSQTMRVLAAYLAHPNVGGAVVIELGCEKTNLAAFGRFLGGSVAAPSKPVVTIGVQQSGGTGGTVREGLKRVAELLPLVNETARTRVSVAELSLGLKCGGSDAFSGVSANPALGVASDLLVARGGTSILTEVPELFGAEPILYRRAKSPEVWRQLQNALAWYERYTGRFGVSPTENPSPGNKEGGLTNIAIKSLGAVAKAGRCAIDGVIDYAVSPSSHGLWVMQGPGYDQYSTPGLVASGATIVAFTTGRGTTIGNAIAPVFKIASNTRIFEQMRDDLDVNAGTVLDGSETVAEAGRRIYRAMVEIASGERPARAEEWRHTEFQIWSEDGVAL